MNLTPEAAIADILELMAERIPANSYIMRAVPTGTGKFNALYASPGFIPAIAKTADGRAYEYDSEMEAEHGAARALFGTLNASRRQARSSKPERYRKLTGAELSILMRRANVTLTWLAWAWGTTEQRVLDWINEADRAPFPLAWVLELLATHPDRDSAFALIEAIVEARTESRRPAREEVR